MLQSRDHLIWGQRAETKPGATRLQGRDDLGQVVADHTESSVFRELLDHWERRGQEKPHSEIKAIQIFKYRRLQKRKAEVNFTQTCSDLIQWTLKTRSSDRYGILQWISASNKLIPHNLPAAKLSGCSVSRVVHSGQHPAEQMAYLAAKHSGHPGSWHRPHPISPTWSPSWRTRGTDKKAAVQKHFFLNEMQVMNTVNRVLILLEDGPGAGETQDGPSYNTDTSVIWCV